MAHRFLEVMSGSLWITVDGLHLLRATAHITRPVSMLPFVARISQMDMRLESSPAAKGIWLPSKLFVSSDVKVLWKEVHRRDAYTYSDFELVR